MAPSECGAAVTLTFDLRASAVNGVPNANSKFVVAGFGDVITVQLFAIITNTDGNQTNDGLLGISGSFVSIAVGSGMGTWSALGTDMGEINPDFRGTGSQSGLHAATDTNGGGFDLGSPSGAADMGVPAPNPYFAANSLTLLTKFGTDPSTPSNLEFLVGTKTFTFDGGLSIIDLNSVGRSTSALTKPIKWTSDGVAYVKNANDAAFIGYGANIFIGAPESSAFGLILMGAFGLIGFRRADNLRF